MPQDFDSQIRDAGRALHNALTAAVRGAVAGQTEATDDLFDAAQEAVPVDTGELKRSGVKGKSVKGSGTDVRATTAAGYTKEYSKYVHEMPNTPGYKWLERTIQRNKNAIPKIIAGESYKAIKKKAR